MLNKVIEAIFWGALFLAIIYFIVTPVEAASPYTLEVDLKNNYIITLEKEIGTKEGYVKIKGAIKDPKSITFVFKDNAGGYQKSARYFIEMIKEFGVPTQAIVEGRAASAAASIVCYCDTVELKKDAYLMWHNGWNQMSLSNGSLKKLPQTEEQRENAKVLWEQCKKNKLLNDEQIKRIVYQRMKIYKLWNNTYVEDFDQEAP